MTSSLTQWVFICAFVLSCCRVQGQVINSGECEDGWVKFNSREDGSSLCIRIFVQQATWRDAQETCRQSYSALINLDMLDHFSYIDTQQDRTMRITDEINTNKIQTFWSGMHIRSGRLMWDDYGPRVVVRSPFAFSPGYSWDRFQPDPTGGDCGRTILRTFDGIFDVTVGLANCTQTLPFVCQKIPIEMFMEDNLDICPTGFVGSIFLPRCYKVSDDQLTYIKATEQCKQLNGGLLMNANTDFRRKLVESIVRQAYRTRETFDDMIVWVRDNRSQECTSFRYTTMSEVPIQWENVSCDNKNLYICTVPVLIPEKPTVTAISDYFDENQLLKHRPFSPLPLTFSLDKKRYMNEAAFLHMPSDIILNSTQFFYKWDFTLNRVEWNIQQYQGINGTYKVNVTIPSNPMTGIGEGGDFFPEGGDGSFVDYDTVRLSTGYYRFDLYRLPVGQVTTVERLIRFSEKDLYIYVVYATFQDGVIGPETSEPQMVTADCHAFNLLKDQNYVSQFELSMFFQTPASIQEGIEYYRGQIEHIDVSKNVSRIRYFVAPTLSRQRNEDFESTVLEAMTSHLRLDENAIFNNPLIKVHSTVRCGVLETVIQGKKLTFFPVRTGSKGYSWERCYPGRLALASAECTGGYDLGARWTNIRLTAGCQDVPILNQSDSTETLKNISETTIDVNNYLDIVNDTVKLTDPVNNLTDADVIYTADILYKYMRFLPANTEQILDDVYDIVNNVLFTKKNYLDSAQRISNAANRIISTTDKLTNEIILLDIGKPVKVVKDYLASVVLEQYGTESTMVIGMKLDDDNSTTIQQDNILTVGQPTDVPITSTDTAIYLTNKLAEGARTRLAFQLYSKTELFSVINSKFKINSKIAAARLTKGNINIEDLGQEMVTAVFKTLENNDYMVCAYWNYSASQDAGGWETRGCSKHSTEDGRVVCKCNHLTNFAVLIDLEAQSLANTHKLILGIITKVGLIISVVCLGITIITFLIFKHLRNGRGQQVLVNLSVAMLCSAILFLVGVERTENRAGCITVAVLLHYFILVTFMWMLVEGLLQYLRFVKVLGTYIPNFMKKSMIPAWGIPLIPVIVILSIDYNMYYGGNGYCWLTWTPFLYGFLIPVAVIIFINIIVFTMVMVNLCCRRKSKGMASNQSERKMAMLHLQAGVSILVVLGLTWVFGFLTVDESRIVFHYLFAIFNAFQGCFIFLLFTFRETRIRQAWRKLCCKKSAYKSNTSHSDSHPKKNGSTETKSSGLSKNSNTHSNGHSEQDSLTFNNPHYSN